MRPRARSGNGRRKLRRWRIVGAIAAIVCEFTLFSATADPTCPDHVYINDYPSSRENGWSEETQGVAHDADYWYFTQRKTLLKIPVGFDLNTYLQVGFQVGFDVNTHLFDNLPTGVTVLSLEDLLGPDSGFNHFGDIDQYGGFIFIPLEGASRAIAAVNAFDLTLVSIAPVNQANAGWVAVDRLGRYLYSSGVNVGGDAPVIRYPLNLQTLRDTGDLQASLGDPEELFVTEANGDHEAGYVAPPPGRMRRRRRS